MRDLPNGRNSDAGGCAPSTMYIVGGSDGRSFTTYNGTKF